MLRIRAGLHLVVAAHLFVTVCAAAEVITFEEKNLPLVLFRIEDKGVELNGPRIVDHGLTDFAHSPRRAIQHCFGLEFCKTPIEIGFTAPQRRVKVWVGYADPLLTARTVVMVAFDEGGGVAGRAETSFAPSPIAIPIRTPLEVTAAAATIKRVVVRFSDAAQVTNGLALDDVEFDTAGPPPSCASTRAPAIALSAPADGETVQLNEFSLAGEIQLYGVSAPEQATVIVSGQGPAQRSSLDLLPVLSLDGGRFQVSRISGLLFPGVNEISLVVADCRYFSSVTRTITYQQIPSNARISVLGLEVSQGAQDLENATPLVAGKRTTVRVYLALTGTAASIGNVTGTLYACRPLVEGTSVCGEALPVAPFSDSVTLRSRNAITLDSSTDVAARQADPNGGLEFELPASWILPGRLHIGLTSLSVNGSPLNLACTGCDIPNPRLPFLPRFFHFEDAPTMKLLIVKVPWHPSSVVTKLFEPREDDILHLKSWLLRAYPISRLDARIGSVSRFGPGVPGTWRVNIWLFGKRIKDIVLGRDYGVYYGLLYDGAPAPGNDFARGLSFDLLGVGSGPTGDPAHYPDFKWDQDGSYGDWYGGHEIGHLHGRSHPGFEDDGGACKKGLQSGVDLIPGLMDFFYPYANGSIGKWADDPGDPSVHKNLTRKRYDPATTRDVMTYCRNLWISDYTSDGIAFRLRNPLSKPFCSIFSPFSIFCGLLGSRKTATSSDESLMVIGAIDMKTNAIELLPFSRLPGVKVEQLPRPEGSSFSIDLKDAAGGVLGHYPFELFLDREAPPGEESTAVIADVVPYAPGTARIDIMKDGVAIASRAVSPHAPNVRVLSPNGGGTFTDTVDVRWEASDADGDRLTYSVHFSNDDGQTWETLALMLEETNYTVALAERPGGDRCRFRVIATDGVNVGSDDSDAPFDVPQKTPKVRIVSPVNDDQFPRERTIVFLAEADDVEDGALESAAFQWQSDRQGSLGPGRSTAAVDLLPGDHVITVTATDSSGAAASASIHIRILTGAPVAVAQAQPPSPIAGVRVNLDASGSRGFGLVYEWSLVGRPVRSQTTLLDPGVIRTRLVPDLPGEYIVQLTVRDATGAAAIDQVRINAIAGPDSSPYPNSSAEIPATSPFGTAVLIALLVATAVLVLHRGVNG